MIIDNEGAPGLALTEVGGCPWGKAYTILIIEDHEVFREGLRICLVRLLAAESAGLTFYFASGLLEAQAMLVRLNPRPDLVILDLNLDDADANDCIDCLEVEWRGVPVVVLSATDDEEVVTRCIVAGVLGYIPKRSNSTIIGSALRLVLAGGHYFPDDQRYKEMLANRPAEKDPLEEDVGVRTRTFSNLFQAQSDLSLPRQIDQLGAREREVLLLVAQGLPNKAIASRLNISLGTVKNYVSKAIKHLGVSSRVQAVRAAFGRGDVMSLAASETHRPDGEHEQCI